MNQFLSLLAVGLLPLCAYAQKPPPVGPPIDETSDCYRYGVDYSAIICRYDDNGGRIFRGFDCRTTPDEHRESARKASPISGNAAKNNAAKADAAQAELATIGKMTASPNPTAGQLTIAFENLPQRDAVLYLTDANARLLHEQEVVEPNTALSLETLPPGVYTVVLVRKGSVIWQTKIVKI